jgi:hypothetical protein
MKITKDFIKKLIKAALKSRPDEIGCDDCFDELHEFAEIKLEGKSPEEAMPLVQDHLERCGECREEFEALLEAMKNIKNPA